MTVMMETYNAGPRSAPGDRPGPTGSPATVPSRFDVHQDCNLRPLGPEAERAQVTALVVDCQRRLHRCRDDRGDQGETERHDTWNSPTHRRATIIRQAATSAGCSADP